MKRIMRLLRQPGWFSRTKVRPKSRNFPPTNLWLTKLLVFVLLLYGCKSPPPEVPAQPDPEAAVYLEGIEAQNLNRIILRFTLEAANPRLEAAGVKTGLWDVEINGRKISEGVKFAPESAAFPAGPSGSVSVPFLMELDIPALTKAGLSPKEDYRVNLETGVTFAYDSGALIEARAAGRAVFPRIAEPVFTITSIAVLKAELVNTRFRVSLRVDNPNPFPMELSSFVYELYGDERLWAEGAEKNVLHIPAEDSTETQLFLVMNFTNMKRPMLDRIAALEDVNYRFAGEVRVTTGVNYLPGFNSVFDLSGYSKVYEN
jgi:LEA14-like dessication related protein